MRDVNFKWFLRWWTVTWINVLILEIIHANIFKDTQALGRRTHQHRDIFKVLTACCRRIFLPRNFFRVSPVSCTGTNMKADSDNIQCCRLVVGHTSLGTFSKTCRLVVGGHTCLGIFSKSCRLVVGGHTGRTGRAFGDVFTAALTEMISAFPET